MTPFSFLFDPSILYPVVTDSARVGSDNDSRKQALVFRRQLVLQFLLHPDAPAEVAILVIREVRAFIDSEDMKLGALILPEALRVLQMV